MTKTTVLRNPLRYVAAAVAFTVAPLAHAQQVNVICSVQADWCNMIQTVFAKSTGIKVNMSLKGSGEALAQLIAEKANPKTDVWFGGTGDPHLQAAELDLTLPYQSPTLAQLQPRMGNWSRAAQLDVRCSAGRPIPMRSVSAT